MSSWIEATSPEWQGGVERRSQANAMMRRALDLGIAELRRRGTSEEEIAALLSRMRGSSMSGRSAAAPL